ncbi:related to dipeptidyl aminopeptidase [Melanopsichium pennsylvanicum]|uniref:Related to dipeptidyl aminopeptidase n=2 Tax=Melanopsichium pennsylvanicum TaxID=63383 RepID=A0AAJ5C896_9BASI|nr:related to dipeptidyl aminopeptidase B [Melanopsichium pennsylvanicum 4]SNX87358.1 related to dipeptidyl aminopeptidase [Melanopsichium pennsylvanicum]
MSPHPPRASYDSQATASDATVDDIDNDDKKPYQDSQHTSTVYPPKRNSSRYGHNDLEEGLGDGLGVSFEDDEEQVGLMQEDRDRNRQHGSRGGTAPTWTKLSGNGNNKRPSLAAGCLIFTGVLLGFMLALPVLQWLSSNTRTPSSSSHTASYASDSAKITSNPNAAGDTDAHRTGSTTWKQAVSPNTLQGHYGLSNTSVFQVDFQDPGYSTYVESALVTGLPQSEVTGSKTSDGHDLMPLDMDTVFGGTLAPQTSDLTWSQEDPDQGVFSHVDWSTRDIWLEDVTHARHAKTGDGKVAPFGGKVLVVQGKNVVDGNGRMLDWTGFKFSPDLKWVLFFSAETGVWRYSKKSRIWLHNIAAHRTVQLGTQSGEPKVSYAAWAPDPAGTNMQEPPSIAFVEDNNLFFVPHAGDDAIQVTTDGAETIFNAIPDWVYEEEVYGTDNVLWFSPGGTKLVYLRLDETAVPVYEFPVYNPDPYRAGLTTPYQKMIKMKYPKPGFPNPVVSVKLIDLDEIRSAARRGVTVRPTQYTLHSPMSTKGKAENEVDKLLSTDAGVKERLVTEVKWVSDNQLLVRETDRYSDVMRIVNFDLALKALRDDIVGEVVRRQNAKAEGSGWIQAAQTIEPLSQHDLSLGSTAYLDLVVSQDGYRHLAYYDSARSDQPIFLTQGKWEIAALKYVDAKRGRAYFVAAKPTPALRNVYYVDLPDWKGSASRGPGISSTYTLKELVALTDDKEPGSYDVSFDPKGAYYVLNYLGPDVPYQKVVGVDDPTFSLMLEENTMLRQLSSQYVKPSNTFYQLRLNSTLPNGDAVLASVKEIRPHDFDPSGATRYPVLIRVYGGPDSQLVDARWNRADWHQYVASTLGYIVIVVDGRGTGFKGQLYRASVAGNLGDVEAQDVNEAARLISTLAYVDENRIGVWGWSYGGYLTGKSVERDTKHIFSLAVSVAPVTKWEFYDSVYTERYMKSKVVNKLGYESAAIHVTPAFGKTKYLLMHGTADDNVNVANSAHLLDLLTKAKVRGFRMRFFTDSKHNIITRGAYRELFEELTRFLSENWGAGGKREKKKPKDKGRPSLHNSVERADS